MSRDDFVRVGSAALSSIESLLSECFRMVFVRGASGVLVHVMARPENR